MSFSGHRLPLVFLDLSGIGHQEDKKKIIWDNIFVPVEWGVFGNLLIVIFFLDIVLGIVYKPKD